MTQSAECDVCESGDFGAHGCACNPVDGDDPRCEIHGSDQ